MIHDGLVPAIGNTPLIKLKRASEETGCTILGKAEFLNPGQSVKDRAALFIIRDAMAKGLVKKGGTIVEGTAGNTGIGLSWWARRWAEERHRHSRDAERREKARAPLGRRDADRGAGGTLFEPQQFRARLGAACGRNSQRPIRTAPSGPTSSITWANGRRISRPRHRDLAGYGGKIHGFICAVGSGGTLVGTAMGLREKNANVKIGIADPYGAALYSYYTTGELKAEGSSISEGIGQGRITKNLEGFKPDFAWRIPMTRRCASSLASWKKRAS